MVYLVILEKLGMVFAVFSILVLLSTILFGIAPTTYIFVSNCKITITKTLASKPLSILEFNM